MIVNLNHTAAQFFKFFAS